MSWYKKFDRKSIAWICPMNLSKFCNLKWKPSYAFGAKNKTQTKKETDADQQQQERKNKTHSNKISVH